MFPLMQSAMCPAKRFAKEVLLRKKEGWSVSQEQHCVPMDKSLPTLDIAFLFMQERVWTKESFPEWCQSSLLSSLHTLVKLLFGSVILEAFVFCLLIHLSLPHPPE